MREEAKTDRALHSVCQLDRLEITFSSGAPSALRLQVSPREAAKLSHGLDEAMAQVDGSGRNVVHNQHAEIELSISQGLGRLSVSTVEQESGPV